MTQRQVSHSEGLPRCRQGHPARHMLDVRAGSAGGGHFIECACCHTRKHESYEAALLEWRRMHHIRAPRPKPNPPAERSNVHQLSLRLPA